MPWGNKTPSVPTQSLATNLTNAAKDEDDVLTGYTFVRDDAQLYQSRCECRISYSSHKPQTKAGVVFFAQKAIEWWKWRWNLTNKRCSKVRQLPNIGQHATIATPGTPPLQSEEWKPHRVFHVEGKSSKVHDVLKHVYLTAHIDQSRTMEIDRLFHEKEENGFNIPNMKLN